MKPTSHLGAQGFIGGKAACCNLTINELKGYSRYWRVSERKAEASTSRVARKLSHRSITSSQARSSPSPFYAISYIRAGRQVLSEFRKTIPVTNVRSPRNVTDDRRYRTIRRKSAILSHQYLPVLLVMTPDTVARSLLLNHHNQRP